MEYSEEGYQQDLLEINNDRHLARVAYLEGRMDGFMLRDALNALDRLENYCTMQRRFSAKKARLMREEIHRQRFLAEHPPMLWTPISEDEFHRALETRCGPVVRTMGELPERKFARLEA